MGIDIPCVPVPIIPIPAPDMPIPPPDVPNPPPMPDMEPPPKPEDCPDMDPLLLPNMLLLPDENWAHAGRPQPRHINASTGIAMDRGVGIFDLSDEPSPTALPVSYRTLLRTTVQFLRRSTGASRSTTPKFSRHLGGDPGHGTLRSARGPAYGACGRITPAAVEPRHAPPEVRACYWWRTGVQRALTCRSGGIGRRARFRT